MKKEFKIQLTYWIQEESDIVAKGRAKRQATQLKDLINESVAWTVYTEEGLEVFR